MAEDTYAMLRKSGAEITKAICMAAGGRRITPSEACYSVAHDVAVGLQLVNGYLSSLPPYWIEPDVEELCRSLLQDLLDITTVRGARFRLDSGLGTLQLPSRARGVKGERARPRNTNTAGWQGSALSKRAVVPPVDSNWEAWLPSRV